MREPQREHGIVLGQNRAWTPQECAAPYTRSRSSQAHGDKLAAETSDRTTVMQVQRLVQRALTALQSRFVKSGVRLVGTRLLGFHIEVAGLEHVPAGEPLIVAAGPHRNWVDGFLLLIALPPLPRMVFLASENVADRLWRRVLLRLVGGIEPVSTTSMVNREAVAAALQMLARGDRLGMFPEGWDRLEDPMREIGAVRRGVAFIAQQSGRRVLPVALAGGKPLWRGKTLRVRIGAPLDPPPADAGKAEQQAWSDSLRAVLQDLIPPEPSEIPVAQRRWPWLTDLFN